MTQLGIVRNTGIKLYRIQQESRRHVFTAFIVALCLSLTVSVCVDVNPCRDSEQNEIVRD